MVIDFSSMEWNANPEFKGGKGVFYNKMVVDGGAKIMYGKLEPGSSIGYHCHEGNAEMVFILSGAGTEISDDVEVPALPGECHYCQEGHCHSLINSSESEDLLFYAVVK